MAIQAARALPQSTEAEQSVLGAILMDGASIEKALDILSVDGSDFYDSAHARMFREMAKMYEARVPIDIVTAAAKFKGSDVLDAVGGFAYFAILAESVPTAANIKYYAKIVKEKSVRRWVISNATDLVDSAYNGADEIDDLVEKAQKRFAITNLARKPYLTMQTILCEVMAELEAGSEPGSMSGLPTGFTDLDFFLGGLQSTDLVIIAGRPSMGKTGVACQMATYLSLHGKKVGFFSIEVSNRQMCKNILANQARVETFKFRSVVKDDDMSKVSKVFTRLAAATFSIDDISRNTLNIARQSRRMKADHGLDIIFIDHLQLIRESGWRGNRNDEIGIITGNLKSLAKELNIPVVVLSQLGRDVEKRGGDCRPRLSDLRDSGNIEQDADVVMFLHREDYYLKEKSTKPGIAEVIIAKHRNGPLGVAELKWSEKFVRFDDLWREGLGR